MFDAPATDLSTTPASERTATPGRLPRAYVAAWAGLTCLAGLYITQVALESTNLPRLIATTPTPDQTAAPGQQAELATLRQNLTEFQREIGRMRADLEVHKSDPSAIASLSALEERMSMTTGIAIAKAPALAPEPAVAANSPAQPNAVSSTAALEAWTGKPAIAPEIKSEIKPAAPTVAEAKPADVKPAPVEPRMISLAPPAFDKMTAPIETGSIAGQPANPSKMSGQLPKAAAGAAQQAAVQAPPAAAVAQPSPAAPIAFGPAVVKPEPKPFAVQLASGTSIDEIRYSWSILSEQHPENLGKLQPRYNSTTSETAGTTFDLLAGPVKTAADAKRICKALAGRGIDCKVASYGGEAF